MKVNEKGVCMKAVRIGLYDTEAVYVDLLTRFIESYGKGRWNVFGYTDSEIFEKAIEKNDFFLLLSTNSDVFQGVKEKAAIKICLYEKEQRKIENEIIYINRFQNAKKICEEIRKEIGKSVENEKQTIPFVGIYSPIGRCGKTSLAYRFLENELYENWLYVGLEDYASEITYTDTGEFLYYIKEEKEDLLYKEISNCNGKIIVSQGAFENRLFGKKELEYLKKKLQDRDYNGVVVDIGTGALKDYELFYSLDYVFVPILKSDVARTKLENFEKLLSLYGIEEVREKMIFLDMEDIELVNAKVDEVIGSELDWIN